MNDRGYLASDAIVALLLVAIGLGAVLKVQALALDMSRRAEHLRETTPAAALAWARLGEVRPGRAAAYSAEVIDQVSVDGRTYRVCQVDITVASPKMGVERRVRGLLFCGGADDGG